MIRPIAVVGVIVGAILSMVSPAHAGNGVYVLHGNVGNDQGISIICANNGEQKWLLKGQSSANKCNTYGADEMYTPQNFDICARPINEPGWGCWLRFNGGTWYNVPSMSGGVYAWSVHDD